ncbi:hypothetical protein ACH5RR_026402 [Cinchona calisaya]|uniref:Uncharacterized protein n=1 Tax=Cinchona calisaya TaxID=153742 RepID=A0ABD2Z5S1_9GENT
MAMSMPMKMMILLHIDKPPFEMRQVELKTETFGVSVIAEAQSVEKYGDGVEEWWQVEEAWEHVGRRGKEKAREDCFS